MSMINDALRRASSTARGTSTPPSPPVEHELQQDEPPPLLPASGFAAPRPQAFSNDSLSPGLESDEPSGPRRNTVQLVLAILLVLAVGAVAVLNYFHQKKDAQIVDVSANSGSKMILPNANAVQAAARTLSAVTNRAAAAPAPAPLSVVAAPPVVAVSAAPGPPPKFPPLRLQSIFYRPSNPSVMINGRTLFRDDEIQGVIVAAINPSSVTLVLSGHTNVLTLR